MHKITVLTVASILSCMVCVAAVAAWHSQGIDKHKLTDLNKPIIVKKSNPVFSIRLKSNPTTGYSWFLRNYDSNLVVPMGKIYHAPHTKMVGAAGKEIWTFRLKHKAFAAPTVTNVTLTYIRPWEKSKNDAQAQTFEVITHGN